jgi:UDP-glucose 4-epimerase
VKILLTGARGRLGRVVEHELRERGDVEVISAISPRTESQAITDVVLDLEDTSGIERIVQDTRPDAVIHLAGLVGAACETEPVRARRVNVQATAHLARAAARHGAGRFVFASTAAVYGDQHDSPAAETDPTRTDSEYARTKLHAEEELQIVSGNATSLAFTALRIFNVYGPGFDDSLVNRLRRSSPVAPVTIRGLDQFVRDYVHSADVAAALVAAAAGASSHRFRIVNIGSGEPTSNRELIEIVGEDGKPAVTIEDGPPSYSCADISVARREFGFSPRRLTADVVRAIRPAEGPA